MCKLQFLMRALQGWNGLVRPNSQMTAQLKSLLGGGPSQKHPDPRTQTPASVCEQLPHQASVQPALLNQANAELQQGCSFQCRFRIGPVHTRATVLSPASHAMQQLIGLWSACDALRKYCSESCSDGDRTPKTRVGKQEKTSCRNEAVLVSV